MIGQTVSHSDPALLDEPIENEAARESRFRDNNEPSHVIHVLPVNGFN